MEGTIILDDLKKMLKSLKADRATVDWANQQLKEGKHDMHESNAFRYFASVDATDKVIATIYNGIKVVESLIDHSIVIIESTIDALEENGTDVQGAISQAEAGIDDLLNGMYDTIMSEQ